MGADIKAEILRSLMKAPHHRYVEFADSYACSMRSTSPE